MITLATYSLAEVFNAPVKNKKKTLPDGRTCRNSDRIILFQTKGVACISCGIEGSIFALQTQREDIAPHVNLYAVDEDGKFVLMTKDHRYPKSKGGANDLSNYDTMCSPCNAHKANKVSDVS